MGTVMESCPYCPECGGHNGEASTYFGNDGQWLKDEDAREIAKALRRSYEPSNFEKFWGKEDGLSVGPPQPALTPKQAEAELADFVRFCEEGGFNID